MAGAVVVGGGGRVIVGGGGGGGGAVGGGISRDMVGGCGAVGGGGGRDVVGIPAGAGGSGPKGVMVGGKGWVAIFVLAITSPSSCLTLIESLLTVYFFGKKKQQNLVMQYAMHVVKQLTVIVAATLSFILTYPGHFPLSRY